MPNSKLLAIIKRECYKENTEKLFTLASGKSSPYYFDLKATLLQPEYLDMICHAMYELIFSQVNHQIGALAGLTMGSDPIIYGISLQSLATDHLVYPIIIRKATKDHGSKKRAEGLLESIDKDNVVLIDDVITTGGSTLQAYDEMKSLSFNIKHAFCVVDRFEGGKENLAKHGIQLHSLFNLDDFRNKK